MASSAPPPPPNPPHHFGNKSGCASSSSRPALRRSKTAPTLPGSQWRREPLHDVTNEVLGAARGNATLVRDGRLQRVPLPPTRPPTPSDNLHPPILIFGASSSPPSPSSMRNPVRPLRLRRPQGDSTLPSSSPIRAQPSFFIATDDPPTGRRLERRRTTAGRIMMDGAAAPAAVAVAPTRGGTRRARSTSVTATPVGRTSLSVLFEDDEDDGEARRIRRRRTGGGFR